MTAVKLADDDTPAPEAPKESVSEESMPDVAEPEDKQKGMADADLQEVIAQLKLHDIILPCDTTIENLLGYLKAALGTAAAHKGILPDEPGPSQTSVPEEDVTPMTTTMSQEFEAKLSATEARLSRAEAHALKLERKRLVDEVKSLFRGGNISKPIADALLKDVAEVQLSFDDKGELAQNHLLTRIDAYKQLGSVFKNANLSHADEKDVDLPDFAGNAGKNAQDMVTTIAKENWQLKRR